jgi:hypothetical protein
LRRYNEFDANAYNSFTGVPNGADLMLTARQRISLGAPFGVTPKGENTRIKFPSPINGEDDETWGAVPGVYSKGIFLKYGTDAMNTTLTVSG